MKNKIIYIILISFVVLFICIFLIVYKLNIKTTNKVNIDDKHSKEEIEVIYDNLGCTLIYDFNYNPNKLSYKEFSFEEAETFLKYCSGGESRWELVKIMCQKNGDWRKLPISQEVKDKYEKTGLLGNEEFDRIEYWEYNEFEPEYDEYDNFGFGGIFCPRYTIWNGNEEKKVIFELNGKSGKKGIVSIDNITIMTKEESEAYLKKREEDSKMFPQYAFSKELWDNGYSIVDWLCGDIYSNTTRVNVEPCEGWVAKTDNFKEKYPNFIDIFEHYSPQEFNVISFISKSEYEDLTATYKIRSFLENKDRVYKVKFILDDKLYLDDVEVEKISEEYQDYGSSKMKLLYKNSDMRNQSKYISSELIEKYKKEGCLNPDIELIDIDAPLKKGIYNTDLYQMTYKNGEKVYYIINYVYDVNNDNDEKLITNVTFEKIPTEKVPKEEVFKIQ